MMKKGMLVILLLLGFSLKSQEKVKCFYHFKLTTLSEKILDMFIEDPMNKGRIESSSSSIVLSFGGVHDLNNELWIFDAELLQSCVDHTYLTKYKGFSVFYQGKILPEYIYKIRATGKLKCPVCDSLLRAFPPGKQIVFSIYDGAIYKIKKGTKIKNIKIEKVHEW